MNCIMKPHTRMLISSSSPLSDAVFVQFTCKERNKTNKTC